ncbi:MAG: hypothetical protein RLZZ501_111 [Pseudomonadota bacterium]
MAATRAVVRARAASASAALGAAAGGGGGLGPGPQRAGAADPVGRPRGGAGLDRVIERQHLIADDLAGLVALAGDHQQVARLQPGNGGADRGAAVGDLDPAQAAGQDRRADPGRILATRIVVGDDDAVGQPAGDRAHQAALAGVAVAAAAEQRHQPPGGMGPERAPHGFQRVGGVGVIDIDRGAVGAGGDPLQPARHPVEPLQRGQRLGRLGADGEGEAEGGQGVVGLEPPGQRQGDADLAPEQAEAQALAGGGGGGLDQADILAGGAGGDQAQAAGAGGGGEIG